MSTPTDLTDIIEDSLTDATIEEPAADETPSEGLEATPEENVAPEAAEASTEPVKEEAQAEDDHKPKPDDFDKKWGLTKDSPTGRENRIPYSRVKKITEKAGKDAEDRIKNEFSPKLKDFETKVGDYETKIKDYESRLGEVAKFEQVMLNDPDQFLGMLSTIPAYAQIFKALAESQAQAQPPAQPEVKPDAEMPQPDQTLLDGSKVYSTDVGLQKLMDWQAKKIEERVTKQVEEKVTKRYAPIENQWQANQRVQAIIPQVQKQIDEARKWPSFNENEADIIKALQADQTLTLEGAYRQVVVPRFSVDRNKIREEILKEIKDKPRSTSVQTSASRPSQRGDSSKPRDITDIINEAIQGLK